MKSRRILKVTVDQDRCVGQGMCEINAPDVFTVGDDGISQVLVDEIPEDQHEPVAAAVASCPSQALTITD